MRRLIAAGLVGLVAVLAGGCTIGIGISNSPPPPDQCPPANRPC